MNKSRFTIGAIVGAVAGIVAGVLTAPRSGRETRADLRGRASELKRETERRANEAKELARSRADEAKGGVKSYKVRGANAVRGVINSAKQSFEEKK